VILSI
jgi:hypothetical protein